MHICGITFRFHGKKIGHKLSPGTYEARMLKTRVNRAGNLELTLTDVKPVETDIAKIRPT